MNPFQMIFESRTKARTSKIVIANYPVLDWRVVQTHMGVDFGVVGLGCHGDDIIFYKINSRFAL